MFPFTKHIISSQCRRLLIMKQAAQRSQRYYTLMFFHCVCCNKTHSMAAVSPIMYVTSVWSCIYWFQGRSFVHVPLFMWKPLQKAFSPHKLMVSHSLTTCPLYSKCHSITDCNVLFLCVQLHLIHWNSTLFNTLEDALGKKNGVLIIALFVQVSIQSQKAGKVTW